MGSRWKSIEIMETETGLFYAFSSRSLEDLGILNPRHQIQIVDIIENYIENNYSSIHGALLIHKASVCLGKDPLYFKVKIKILVPRVLGPFIKIKRVSVISSDEYLDMYNRNEIL